VLAKYEREYWLKIGQRGLVYRIVASALRSGELVRPDTCSI
jgi:hypothetical protein